MKQLTNTEIQILSLMLPHALHAVDNSPYYFSDTWFTRKQATDLISKLDSMDDEIRKSREDGYRYVLLVPNEHGDFRIPINFDTAGELESYVKQQGYFKYMIHKIPLKERYIYEKLNDWRIKRRNTGLHQTI